jgi:hypothetical protein
MMERLISGGYSELIEATFDLLPVRIADNFRHVHFFTGTDPIFAGLIRTDAFAMKEAGYKIGPEVYRTGACCSYLHNQTHFPLARRHTTIVLPQIFPIDYPIHELGHALDGLLGWSHKANPVTEYAKTNDTEAFAEAFTSWLIPGYAEWPDEKTISLFEHLASDSSGVNDV